MGKKGAGLGGVQENLRGGQPVPGHCGPSGSSVSAERLIDKRRRPDGLSPPGLRSCGIRKPDSVVL